MLIAPAGKRRSFVRGSGHICWNQIDGGDTKRPELSNGSCRRVFVRDPAPTELTLHHGIRSFAENCDSRGYAAVNKIGGFQHSGAVGIDHHDDGVGWFDAVIDD